MKILAAPTNRVFQGAAERRCPLCRCNLALSVKSLVGDENCPNCGLDIKKLESSRLEATPLKPVLKPTSSDPLERWLSDDAVQPKCRSEWEHVALWIRKHPRVSGLAAALLVAAVVVPIVLFSAYSRTAASLRQAAADRAAAEQERRELAEEVDRSVAELKMHQERMQGQQQEHEWLKNQFRELQANYQQTQQQVRIAENLLHGTLRESRPAPAEQTPTPPEPVSVATPAVESNPPAAISAPAPAVQVTLPVVNPTLPSAALASPPAVRLDPPVAASSHPAPQPEIRPQSPAADVISPVTDAAPVEAAPPDVIKLALPADDPAATQESQHNSPAASAFAVQPVQPAPTHSSLVLIREVPTDSNAVVDSLDATPVAPATTWSDTPQSAAQPIQPVEERVQSLISRMEEMRARGHNTPAPVTWQSKKSELFRLE